MRTYLWTWGVIQAACLAWMLIVGGPVEEWVGCFAGPPVAALAVILMDWYGRNRGVPVVIIDDRRDDRRR